MHILIINEPLFNVKLCFRINYVHKLAHYKMSTQIKDQTNAFVKGFHSIIDPQWMSMFSAREFQRVISGDDTDINIDELRYLHV